MTRARILVVDDHELFRESLVSLLAHEPDMTVVGQGGDGLEALQLVAHLQPDLVLMDIHMPISDGVEATARIRTHFPATRVLILSISHEKPDLLDALRAGASGYVEKDSSKSQFLRSIRQALAGESALNGRQTALVVEALRESVMIDRQRPEQVSRPEGEDLTARELEVLELLAQGASNEEIGQALTVSLATVKSHVRNVLRKLDAPNRRLAVKAAQVRGLLPAQH